MATAFERAIKGEGDRPLRIFFFGVFLPTLIDVFCIAEWKYIRVILPGETVHLVSAILFGAVVPVGVIFASFLFYRNGKNVPDSYRLLGAQMLTALAIFFMMVVGAKAVVTLLSL